jgi:hypothetical protein
MKMYKVYECEGYTFKWSGGCHVHVYWEGIESGGDSQVDSIEFYETYTDKEVGILCLEWLVEKCVIEDADAYLFLG